MNYLKAGALEIALDDAGLIQSATVSGKRITPEEHPSPLLTLKIGSHLLQPTYCHWNPVNGNLSLGFDGHSARIKVLSSDSHLSFELTQVKPATDVDAAVWGPYPTNLREMVGETIGVVQGGESAFGLQILNPKTMGGFPTTEDDVEPGRGTTAIETDFGSAVQAYTRNRAKSRIIENWQHPFYTAPAFKDGGVIGSKIALFGCSSADALNTIGEIEVAEELPHPKIDGVWGKVSPTAHESYLIMGFNAQNLDDCLSIAEEAGLRYLYSDSCFHTWGHFELDPKGFPKNWETMKECVVRAKARGIRLGVHTLSNFITTNDPYVTPKPDPRLGEVGASELAQSIDASQTELVIEDPKFFNQMANNTLRTVRVGDELIQYDSVSKESPWRLLKCKRGAFGTSPANHSAKVRIAKLMDHGYGTFLTNAGLSEEIARTIASLFNQTGLQQVSMDGLEGNLSTGLGQYGKALFAKSWYDALSPQLKGQIINDASTPGAFSWHINTRENWGEPWNAGFRKSQTEYRLKNQEYFRRNLMPGMLGWFEMTSETTPEDIQWLLARAAGFDAGFCITTGLQTVMNNPDRREILASVKAWESARRAHVFGEALQTGLRDINKEFELVQPGEKIWLLTPMNSQKFSVTSKPFITHFEVPRYAKGSKLILQAPKGVKFTVTIDSSAYPATDAGGSQRITVGLESFTSGTHELQISPPEGGAKDSSVDGELRTPISQPIRLESAHP